MVSGLQLRYHRDNNYSDKNCIFSGHLSCVPQVSPDIKTDRDVLMYRAYIAQRKYGVVLDEVTSSSPPALQAVKMFAEYLSSDRSRR